MKLWILLARGPDGWPFEAAYTSRRKAWSAYLTNWGWEMMCWDTSVQDECTPRDRTWRDE